jgi:hypothetical protein
MTKLLVVMQAAINDTAFDNILIPSGTSHLARYEVATDDGMDFVPNPLDPGNWYQRWALTPSDEWVSRRNDVAAPDYAPPFSSHVTFTSYVYSSEGGFWRVTMLQKCRYRLPIIGEAYQRDTYTRLSDLDTPVRTTEIIPAAAGSFVEQTPMEQWSAFGSFPTALHRERHLVRFGYGFP